MSRKRQQRRGHLRVQHDGEGGDRKGREAMGGVKMGIAGGGRGGEEHCEEFTLDVSAVGKDPRTTVMIKNIPNKYTQRNLLDLIDAVCAGVYV